MRLLLLSFSSCCPCALSSFTELPEGPSIGLMVLKEVLEFIDMFTVVVFSVEIILKLIDNFKSFWKNGWNVFDLIVTVLVC